MRLEYKYSRKQGPIRHSRSARYAVDASPPPDAARLANFNSTKADGRLLYLAFKRLTLDQLASMAA